MTSKAIWVFALVVLSILEGCQSNGGGSQTNWVTCKKDSQCAMGICVQGHCQSATDSTDSGAGGATAIGSSSGGSTDSGAGATGSSSGRMTDSGAGGATPTGSSSGGSAESGATAAASNSSGQLGAWTLTADYPLTPIDCADRLLPDVPCAEHTCVESSGYAYCLGGKSKATYYSQLSPTGVGSWIPAADYPVPIKDMSCVVASDHIYCVGGFVGGADGADTQGPTASVYHAPLSLPGIGAWGASTPFPRNTSAPRCMANAGYIYCISPDPNDPTAPGAYFAPISSSGVGTWAPTIAPPTGTQGCVSINGYAYCFGGANCAPRGASSDCYSPSYFAPLTANGIGTWKATAELPTAVSAKYASAGSYIYYLSIPAFFASVSAEGIGSWQTTTNYPVAMNYPVAIYPAHCISSAGYLYCGSPTANGSYFAQIGASNPRAFQLENPPPFPRSEYLVPASNPEGACGVTEDGVTSGTLCFSKNIDYAAVFDCASGAKTPVGCRTTVASSDTAYNYDLTIWYPCANSASADTNCCFLPSVGYDKPLSGWCTSVGSNSFIIGREIALQ